MMMMTMKCTKMPHDHFLHFWAFPINNFFHFIQEDMWSCDLFVQEAYCDGNVGADDRDNQTGEYCNMLIDKLWAVELFQECFLVQLE